MSQDVAPGRTRVEPDPGRVHDRAGLRAELELVKERSGLSYRQLHRATGRVPGADYPLPFTTIRDYVRGASLPTWNRLELILRACGVTDAGERERWAAALERVTRGGRRSAPGPNPYRGLAPYGTEDAAAFHGRERLTGELLARLRARAASGGRLVVVGPSGCGTTSLLHAGLVPAVARGELGVAGAGSWPVVCTTPGGDPPARLAACRAAVGDGPALVVVDQAEQLFDGVAAADRAAFLDELAARTPGWLVVLGLRADVAGPDRGGPGPAAVLGPDPVVVAPMTEDELRRAVVEPARAAGGAVAEALVEVLLAELRPDGAAGSLPLLSLAMARTWDRARGGELTLAAYRAGGGVHGAVAATAEDVYGELDREDRRLARLLFLRLVRQSDDAAATRRAVRRAELGAGAAAVADRFVRGRLLTAESGRVEIAHETVLRAWPRLRDWLAQDPAGHVVRARLTESAALWRGTGRDDGALLRGAPLAAAAAWYDAVPDGELLGPEVEFLAASRARARAERHAAGRLRVLAAVLAVLLVLAAALLAVAQHARRDAAAQRDLATARQVAGEADRLRADQPSLAAQLALAAHRIAPQRSTRSALLESTAHRSAARLLGPGPRAVAVAPAAGLLVTVGTGAGEQVLHLHDLTDPDRPRRTAAVAGLPGATALAVDPAGRRVVVATADGAVRTFAVGDPVAPVPLGPPLAVGAVRALAVDAAGGLAAAGLADGSVVLVDLAGPPRRVGAPAPLVGPVHAVAFGAGSLLAAGGDDGAVLVDVRATTPPRPLGAPSGTGAALPVRGLAFTSDGSALAVGGDGGTVQVWDVRDPAAPAAEGPPLVGPAAAVEAVAVSADGTLVTAGAADHRLWTWPRDGGTGRADAHPGPVTGLAYLGDRLVTAGEDGTVQVRAATAPRIDAGGPVRTVAAAGGPSPVLLVATGGPAGQARLWDVADPAAPRPLGPPMTAPGLTGHAAVRADRRLVAAGAADGRLHLVDTTDPAAPRPLDPLVVAAHGAGPVAFAPDGRLLAAGGGDGAVGVWDVTDPGAPRRVGGRWAVPGGVEALAFSADGQRLAVGAGDGAVRLHDVTAPSAALPTATVAVGAPVGAVAFARGPALLATGAADGSVRLWDVAVPASPRPVGAALPGPLAEVYGLAFGPGGAVAAAGGDGLVWTWDADRPQAPAEGARLAAGAPEPVRALAFVPAAGVLAAGGADGVVRLWLADPERAAERVCARAGEPITAAEWARFLPGRAYHPPC